MDSKAELQFEYLPFIRTYKSGLVERLCGTEILPATTYPATGVVSKDVIIDSDTSIAARLFLPTSARHLRNKLPIVVYYHGGGFCIGSPYCPPYHFFVSSLVARANVIAVSVDYRLAPEHPLPIAYDDSLRALQWVASHAKGGHEEWLANLADFEHLFLAGDSAGANIAHRMAVRAGEGGLKHGVRIKGMAFLHPFFWGTQPVGLETRDAGVRAGIEGLWQLVCAGRMGMDDECANPMADGVAGMAGVACERVLVCVAEMDVLRERGKAYCEGLTKSGWGGEVDLLESVGEEHVFYMFRPECKKALELMERLVAFFSRD
ncbi:probable carboxylesterase 2 [Elaeis guineensis]|uniref:probable carboxylesterase 2 n=1 Tax=Elaeis guineensis var. tenera TaxID=51953 RepID=UPI003C6D76FF